MSISKEEAKKYAYKKAVTCCKIEEGKVIQASDLEDPTVLPALESSGLLNMPENNLKIGQVIGAKLLESIGSLTPLTRDILDGVKGLDSKEEAKDSKEEEYKKDLKVETDRKIVEKTMRKLQKKHFKIEEVKLGDETKIEGGILTIRENIIEEAISGEDLVVDMDIDIITPERYAEYSETIMDIQPIATKEKGGLGEGVTRILDGVVVMVTGIDEDGVQIGEFGSSEGSMEENICWGRPGSPDKGEIIIRSKVTIKSGKGMERPGPMAAHNVTDIVVREIREELKNTDEKFISKIEDLIEKRKLGKPKIVIVKEIMGQGAMHDNYLFPNEPVGIVGAKANVDLGNVPVVASPLQVLDGCVHALTCIGPASKETSRHYFREPLVIEAMNDEEFDLAGIIFVGSPQANAEKFYVSKLLGMTIEAMDIDGAIVTTEGFGNNHIDFASHIEEIGSRGIPVVGVTFSGVQGQLVAGNKYMDAMVDNNKSSLGIEDEVLSKNCHTREDAIRALFMLKSKMSGVGIIESDVEWSFNAKRNNIDKIEEKIGKKIREDKKNRGHKNGKVEV